MAKFILYFVFWGLINVFGLAMSLFIIAEGTVGESFPLMYPTALYRKTKFNIFGTALVYLLQTIVFPVPFVITLMYWLTHVGRKK